MNRTASISILMALALMVLAGTAQASGLRVIKQSRSSGDFAVTALNASANHVRALWMRGYGHGLSGQAVAACSKGYTSIGSKSTTLNHIAAGRLYRIRLPFAGDCQVTASLSGSGAIKLQVLR